jgi:hypothetical protein
LGPLWRLPFFVCTLESKFNGLPALENSHSDMDPTWIRHDVRQRNQQMPYENDPDGDRDLLLGCKAITDFINTQLDLGQQISKQVVFVWCEKGYIPTRRIGARIVASKTAIRRALTPD